MDKYQTLREKNTPSNNVYPNIKGQNIPDGEVTTAKIADAAITAVKIADDAVTQDKIVDLNVTQDKIALLAVGTPQLKDDAVTLDKLSISIVSWSTSAITDEQDLYYAVKSLLQDIRNIRIFFDNGGSITDFIIKANDNYANETFIFDNNEITISSHQDAIDFYNDYIVPGYIKILRLGD